MTKGSRSVRLPFSYSSCHVFRRVLLLHFDHRSLVSTFRTKSCFAAQNGFTLLELILVITIVGIISIFAVASYNNSSTTLQYKTVIRKIASDVRYAQSLAIHSGQGTRVFIEQTNNRYTLKWSDGTYIKKPVGGDDFIVQLGSGDFSLVQITGTAFFNGRLDFSTAGAPLNSGNTFSGDLSVVSINNAKKIVVTANTGFLRIEDQ